MQLFMNRRWCVCLSHCISWQLPVYNWIKRKINMMVYIICVLYIICVVYIICVCSFMYGVIPVYGTNKLLFIFCKSSFVQEEFVLFILEISWFTVSTKKNFTIKPLIVNSFKVILRFYHLLFYSQDTGGCIMSLFTSEWSTNPTQYQKSVS